MELTGDPRLGTTLAGYRIESPLGRGGMSVVYLAEDLRLRRRVALKVLAPELARDEAFRARFLEESELAASLDHPNIVPVYEAGEADGHLFIAMRYVEGSDLRQRLRTGPVTAEAALTILAQVAAALDAAHEAGLVHRDVKPSNILLAAGAGHGGGDHAYLTDFGLTRRLSDERAPIDEDGMMGSIDYVAPEQIAGGEVDGRADVYSLACVLHECLTGEPPFTREHEVAVLFAHLEEAPPGPTELRPELPGSIDEVVRKALAKSPADRYPDCGALCRAAREALEVGAPRERRRRLVLPALLAASVAIVVTVVAVLLLTGEPAPAGAGSASVAPLASPGLMRIDPSTGQTTATIPLGSSSDSLAVGSGAVWVGSVTDEVVHEIDPSTAAVTQTVDVSAAVPPQHLAADEDGLYLGRYGALPQPVWRYDTASGKLEEGPGVKPFDLVTDSGILFVSDDTSPSGLVRLSTATLETFSHTDLPVCGCGSIAVADGIVWVAGGVSESDTVWKVDARDGRVIAQIPLGFATSALAADRDALWLTDIGSDSVVRLDRVTNELGGPIRVGRAPTSLALGGGFLWTASARDHTITRIDMSTEDVRTIDVGGSPTAIVVAYGAVWAAVDVR